MEISVNDIRKSYRKHHVLNGISFTASAGECIGIAGKNGCGKSTLLSILAGVQRRDSGSFALDGHELFLSHKDLRNNVGYVPQGTPLMEELNAKDNLLLWYTKDEMEKELSEGVLKLLGIDEFLKTTVSKMSGGMKKRLSIGCAMSKKPPVLLLDEPCAALDLECKEKIISYLKDYKSRDGIVVITSHDAMELSICDRMFIMRDGVLVSYTYTGDIEDLVNNL